MMDEWYEVQVNKPGLSADLWEMWISKIQSFGVAEEFRTHGQKLSPGYNFRIVLCKTVG